MILAASTEAAATEAALSIGPVYWAWFIGAVLIFLALDLGVFHRKPHAVGFGEEGADAFALFVNLLKVR